MNRPKQLSEEILKNLICPVCRKRLNVKSATSLQCTSKECQLTFPVIDNIPVLLNEEEGVCSVEDILPKQKSEANPLHGDGARHKWLVDAKFFLGRVLPSLSHNLVADKNYIRFKEALLEVSAKPRVLIVGGRVLGGGLQNIVDSVEIEFVETDISFGDRTQIICDGHFLPFGDNMFDGVIIQAVLEHVADPYRCVSEIYRVLSGTGIVYAETPFMQQVHEGRFDFTRFTHRGHRRLFRNFAEIDSGAVSGPGMALGWAYRYFLMSFAKSSGAKSIFSLVARITGFWLKYFDYFFMQRPFSVDAASGIYFLGRKSKKVLSDKELVQLY